MLLTIAGLIGSLPSLAGEADASGDYKLGPGDQIRISVLHEDNLTMEVRLSDRGTISYPMIGQIDAGGKTTREVESLIRDELSGKYLMDPQVSVNIMEFRKFFVGGEVKSPGGFPFTPGMTVLQAIAQAGGFTDEASEQVWIIHEHEPATSARLIDGQSPVRPGDHLEVREAGDIVVEGQVNKPGVYPYKRGLTVHKAIALAGGQTERASKTILLIHEDDPDHKAEEVGPFTPVRPGDLIHVEESFF
ncbi:MAG: SLBB domain-containing protein [Methylococcus sp.]